MDGQYGNVETVIHNSGINVKDITLSSGTSGIGTGTVEDNTALTAYVSDVLLYATHMVLNYIGKTDVDQSLSICNYVANDIATRYIQQSLLYKRNLLGSLDKSTYTSDFNKSIYLSDSEKEILNRYKGGIHLG